MSAVQEETRALFRRAVERASLAPSVHNTQPWHFVVRPDLLELHDESDRQLRALDPTGRQLVISCGCALFNARVALSADRVVAVDRLPDRTQPDLLARSGGTSSSRVTIDDVRCGFDLGSSDQSLTAPMVEPFQLRRDNVRRPKWFGASGDAGRQLSWQALSLGRS